LALALPKLDKVLIATLPYSDAHDTSGYISQTHAYGLRYSSRTLVYLTSG